MPLAINNISCSNASPNTVEENDDIPSSSYKAPSTKGKGLNDKKAECKTLLFKSNHHR